MLFINYPSDQWRQWDTDRMLAFNYRGGYCKINENALGGVESVELDSWHELYLVKKFCPLTAEKRDKDVWIAPFGEYFIGEAHDVAAEYILDVVYGETHDMCWAGDILEDKGWVRATTSAMWEYRLHEFNGKKMPQKQYDALFDYCQYHNLKFPKNIEVIDTWI